MAGLIDQINRKIASFDKVELLKSIGYHSAAKALERLDSLLESDSLYDWFKTGEASYDLKYTSAQFIEKISVALGIDRGSVRVQVEKAYERRDAVLNYPSSRIFINTGFKRKNEPIFALAALEARRNIKLDTEKIIDMSYDEQLLLVKSIIKEHYRENGGGLGIWGNIKNYVWYFGDERGVVFSPDGIIIDDNTSVSVSKASIEFKGKDIAPIIAKGT